MTKKTMEKLLDFGIRRNHSLDDQKKLPPAAARCASENRNYTSENGQCPPALTVSPWELLNKSTRLQTLFRYLHNTVENSFASCDKLHHIEFQLTFNKAHLQYSWIRLGYTTHLKCLISI